MNRLSHRTRILQRMLLIAAASAVVAPAVSAQTTWYWDGAAALSDNESDNVTTTGLDWLSGGYWDNGVSQILASWTSGDSAVFGGSAASQTVTVAGTITLGNLTFGGGALGATGSGTSYTLTGGTLSFSGGTITTNTSASIASALAGTSFVKSGAGALTLTSAGTLTGTTTISAGRINISNGNALGTTSSVVLNNAATGSSATGLYLDTTAGTVTFSRGITVANQGTGTVTLGSASTANLNQGSFSGAIRLDRDLTLNGGSFGGRLDFTGGISSGTGLTNVTIAGTTRVLFNGTTANTYRGATTINSGATLQLSDGTAVATNYIPDAYLLTVNGTLNLAKGANSETVGGLAGSGVVQGHPGVNSVTSTFIINTAGGSSSFSGVLGNGGASGATLILNKNGTGTQVLSGANTYTGATVINAGALVLTGSGVLGGTTGSTTDSNNIVFASSSGNPTLRFETAAQLGNAGQIRFRTTTAGNVGRLNFVGTTAETVSKAIQSDTSIGMRFDSNSWGAGSVNYTGGFGSVTGNRPILLGGSGVGTLTSAVTSNGSGTLTKDGSGTWTVAGASTFTGATAVNAGVLNLTGSLTSAITVSSGAALRGTGSTTGNITFNAGSAIIASATGANAVQGATVTANATTSVFVAGAPSGSAATVDVIRYTAATGPTLANFSAAANYRSGAYTNDAVNKKITLTYTAGTRSLGDAGITWDNGTTTGWTGANAGADGRFFWGDAVSFGNVTTTRTATLSGTLAPSSVTVSNAANQITFGGSGVLAGAGSLTMSGAGDLQINTANTYLGGTTITSGRIRVGSATALGLGRVDISGSGATGGQVYTTSAVTLANDFYISGFGGNAVDTVQRGALRIDGSTLSGTVTLTGAAGIGVNSGTGTISGSLAGTSDLTVNSASGDTGTLNLSGDNRNFTGNITLTRGTLGIRSSAGLGGAPSVSVADSTIIRFGNSSGSAMTSTGHVITLGNGSGLSVQGGNGGAVTTVADNVVLNSATTAARIGGFIFGNNGVFSGTISGTGALAITGFDGGTNGGFFTDGWRSNSYVGNTTISGLGEAIFRTTAVSDQSVYTPFGQVISTTSGTVTITNNNVTFRAPSTGNTYYLANNFQLVASGGSSLILRMEDAVSRITGNVSLSHSGAGFLYLQPVYTNKPFYIDGVVSGSGTATVTSNSGALASLILTNTGNTFSGTYLLNSAGNQPANLQLEADGAAQFAAINLAVSGSRLSINTTNATIASLTGVSGADIAAVGSNRTLTVNQASDSTHAGTIGANGAFLALVKSGAGRLTLTGSNSHSGGTTVNAGTLALGHATNTLLDAGAVTVNAGELSIAGNSDTVGAVTLAGGSITGTTGTLTGASYDVRSGTISAILGGAGSALTKSTAGTVTLSGTNTFGGATTVSGGTLSVTGSITGASTVQSGATLGGTGTVGAVTLNNGGNLSAGVLNVGSLTLGNLDVAASATANLVIGNLGAYASNAAFSAGVVTLNTDSVLNLIISGFAIGQDYKVLSYANGSTTFTPGTNLTLQAINAGRLSVTLDTSVANMIMYDVTGNKNYWSGASSGVWQKSGATNWLIDAVSDTTVFLDGDSIIFDQTGANTAITIAETVTPGGTIEVMGSNDYSFSGSFGIAGSGALTKTGNGKLTLNTDNTFSGGASLQSGRVVIGSNTALGSGIITLAGSSLSTVAASSRTLTNAVSVTADTILGDSTDNGSLIFNTGTFTLGGSGARTLDVRSAVTLGGVLSGNDLTKVGNGTLTISGANAAYAGTITATAGTILVGNANALGTGTLSLSGATLSSDSSTARTLANALTLGGNVTLGDATNTGALTFSSTVDLADGNRTVNTASNVTFGGIISSATSASGALTKSGAGTLTLSGDNTYTGGTTVSNGTLLLGAANRLADTGAVSLASGSTFNLGGFADTVGAITLDAATISNGTLTASSIAATSSGTISAILAGSGTLTKTGAGTLTLSGASSSYAGAITVSNGTLLVGGASALGTGSVSVASTLAFGVNTSAGSAAISLANGATVSSDSTTARTVANALTFNGNATFGDATNTGALTFSGAVALADGNRTITTPTGASATISGIISSTTSASGALTKAGAGTLVLSNANTYGGGTTLNTGTLQVSNATGLGTGTLTVNGGTLTTAASALTLTNAITLNSGVIFTGTAGTQGMRLDGVISGTGGITKEGSGRVTLTADNTFSGSTSITAGILAIGLKSLESSTSVDIGASGTLAIAANGGTTIINNLNGVAGATILSSFNLSGDGARPIIINQSVDGTYAGVITPGSNRQITVTKSGTATLNLSGASTYAGGFNLSQGTVIANNGNALGNGGTVTIGDAETGSNNTTLRLGNVTMARAVTIANNGSGVVTLGSDGSADTPTFSGAITLAKDVTLDGSTNSDRLTFSGGIGGTGNVTIAGTGRVVFQNTAVSYAGNTTINAGSILQLGTGATSLSLLPDASIVTIGAGGFLKLAKGSDNETIGGLSGSGTVRAHEAIGSAAAVLTLNVSGSVATQTFSGLIENGGASGTTLSLTKSGSGTQVLSGANTYTGGTELLGGVLSVANLDSLGSNAGGGNTGYLAVKTTGTFSYTGESASTTRNLFLDNGLATLEVTNAATTLTWSDSSTKGGANGGLITKAGAGTLELSGAITSGNAANAVTVSGGTLRLLGSNTYAGATTIASGATLEIGGSGSLSSSSAISLDGTLSVATSSNQTLGALTGAGLLTKSGNGTLTIGTENATFGGSATVNGGTLTLGNSNALGGRGVTVNGGGTLDLSNNNVTSTITLAGGTLNNFGSYTGTLTATGNNAINGTINSTFVTGGTLTTTTGLTFTEVLKGTGNIVGNVTVDGATHTPGNSPGVQTIDGNLTYSGAASIVEWELIANTSSEAQAGIDFDKIVVNGNLDFSIGVALTLIFDLAGSSVDWNDAFWAANRSWTIYDVSGSTTGFSNLSLTDAIASPIDGVMIVNTATDSNGLGLQFARLDAGFYLGQQGADVRLYYRAVPEPSTYGLILGGLALAGAAIRRRKKKSS